MAAFAHLLASLVSMWQHSHFSQSHLAFYAEHEDEDEMLRNDDPLALWPDDWAAGAAWHSFASHGDPVGQFAFTHAHHQQQHPFTGLVVADCTLLLSGTRTLLTECQANVLPGAMDSYNDMTLASLANQCTASDAKSCGGPAQNRKQHKHCTTWWSLQPTYRFSGAGHALVRCPG